VPDQVYENLLSGVGLLLALCEALEVAKPYEATDSTAEDYGFERWVQVPHSAAKAVSAIDKSRAHR